MERWACAALLMLSSGRVAVGQQADLAAGVSAAKELLAKGDRAAAITGLQAAISTAEAGVPRGEAKELLADWLADAQGTIEALRLYAQAASEAPDRAPGILPKLVSLQQALPPGFDRVEALRLRAAVEAQVPGTERAGRALSDALAALDEALLSYRALPDVHHYLKSRREVDRPLVRASIYRQLAGLHSARGDTAAAVAAWESSLVAWPADPERAAVCLHLSAALAEDEPDKALAYALRCLDSLGDRAAPGTTAKTPENSAFVTPISTPCDPGRVRATVAALAAIAARTPRVALPVSETREAFVVGWAAADSMCHDGRVAEGLEAWRDLGTRHRGTVLGWLATLARGQWAYICGRYMEADEALDDTVARAPGGDAAALASYSRAHVALADGDLEAARDGFAAARQALDPGVAATSALRQAETEEALGDMEAAQGRYEELAAHWPDEYVGQAAQMGLARLAGRDFSLMRAPREERRAVYLGADRETHGRWRTYGRDAFLLCGSNGYEDTCGGARWPVAIRGYLGSGEKVWFWTQLEDRDPSMLYNPTKGYSHPLNWDDGGEKQQVGTGPDLLVDVDVPAGLFRLSLYFVNDHNYYEPNREYTVYVLDGANESHVLAACPVRDFLNGVYQHFAVAGPATITVRVFRGLSLNTLLQAVFLDGIGHMPASEALDAGIADRADATPTPAAASTVGEALRRAQEVGSLLPDLEPTERAAKAWGVVRECRDAGCGRDAQEQWLRNWAAAVRAGTSDEQTDQQVLACAEALCRAGYIGAAQIVDGLAYPPPHPQVSRQSVTVALGIADRYAGPLDYPQVANRADGPGQPIRAPLDDRYAQAYLAETLRRLWAEQPDRAQHLALMLADGYLRRQWLGMARPCYESVLGEERDFSRLTPEQHRNYAFTVPEGAERIPVLEALLHPPELPAKEVVLRGQLLWSYLQADDMEHAEAEAWRILDLDVGAGYKCSHVFKMAAKYRSRGDEEKAAQWCRTVIEQLPGTPVVEAARHMLRDIERADSAEQGGR